MDSSLLLEILPGHPILPISLKLSIPITSKPEVIPIQIILLLSPTQDDPSGTNEPFEIPSSTFSHPTGPNFPRNPLILSPQPENTPTPSLPTAIPMNSPPTGNEIVLHSILSSHKFTQLPAILSSPISKETTMGW